MSLTDNEKIKLKLRRQFILGPYFIEGFPTWNKISINKSMFLTVHPDLEITKTSYSNNSITLMGYILDPYNPLSSNLDICNRLLRQIRSADDLFQHIEPMGGRFAIILNYDGNLRIFTDAIGLRPVYYARNSGVMWCASQPGSISKQLGLEFGKDTWNEFLNSRFFKNNPEHWYPGDSSPGIFHLLPNQYLNLNTGETVRYWPKKILNPMPLQECVEQASDILQRLMKAAFHRFKLALSITAGYDTRLLLAASKQISKDIVIFTQVHPRINEKHMDIWVPSTLLTKLGLKHVLVRCTPSIDDEFLEFLEIYKHNFPTARSSRALMIYYQYKYWNKSGMILVLGTGGELFRCKYGHRKKYSGKNSIVDGKTLARFTWMKCNSFAINQYEKWLATTKGIWEDFGINILDLFHWEVRKANWGSMNQTEADIAHETFFPYNCRYLLSILLSAKEQYRMPPNFKLNRRLVAHMWPELLDVPINPYPFRTKIYRFVRAMARRFDVDSG